MEEKGDAEFQKGLGVAIKALASFEKFSAEIDSLLQRKGYSEAVVARILAHLQGKGVLNDSRCAQLASHRMAEKGAGPEKIRRALLARGAPAYDVDSAVQALEPVGERIRKVLEKKYGHEVPVEKAARFLFSRGFTEDEIEEALKR